MDGRRHYGKFAERRADGFVAPRPRFPPRQNSPKLPVDSSPPHALPPHKRPKKGEVLPRAESSSCVATTERRMSFSASATSDMRPSTPLAHRTRVVSLTHAHHTDIPRTIHSTLGKTTALQAPLTYTLAAESGREIVVRCVEFPTSSDCRVVTRLPFTVTREQPLPSHAQASDRTGNQACRVRANADASTGERSPVHGTAFLSAARASLPFPHAHREPEANVGGVTRPQDLRDSLQEFGSIQPAVRPDDHDDAGVDECVERHVRMRQRYRNQMASVRDVVASMHSVVVGSNPPAQAPVLSFAASLSVPVGIGDSQSGCGSPVALHARTAATPASLLPLQHTAHRTLYTSMPASSGVSSTGDIVAATLEPRGSNISGEVLEGKDTATCTPLVFSHSSCVESCPGPGGRNVYQDGFRKTPRRLPPPPPPPPPLQTSVPAVSLNHDILAYASGEGALHEPARLASGGESHTSRAHVLDTDEIQRLLAASSRMLQHQPPQLKGSTTCVTDDLRFGATDGMKRRQGLSPAIDSLIAASEGDTSVPRVSCKLLVSDLAADDLDSGVPDRVGRDRSPLHQFVQQQTTASSEARHVQSGSVKTGVVDSPCGCSHILGTAHASLSADHDIAGKDAWGKDFDGSSNTFFTRSSGGSCISRHRCAKLGQRGNIAVVASTPLSLCRQTHTHIPAHMHRGDGNAVASTPPRSAEHFSAAGTPTCTPVAAPFVHCHFPLASAIAQMTAAVDAAAKCSMRKQLLLSQSPSECFEGPPTTSSTAGTSTVPTQTSIYDRWGTMTPISGHAAVGDVCNLCGTSSPKPASRILDLDWDRRNECSTGGVGLAQVAQVGGQMGVPDVHADSQQPSMTRKNTHLQLRYLSMLAESAVGQLHRFSTPNGQQEQPGQDPVESVAAASNSGVSQTVTRVVDSLDTLLTALHARQVKLD